MTKQRTVYFLMVIVFFTIFAIMMQFEHSLDTPEHKYEQSSNYVQQTKPTTSQLLKFSASSFGFADVTSWAKPFMRKWVAYNPTICRVPSTVFNDLFSPILQIPNSQDVFAVSWFVKVPNAPYGSKVYVGFVTQDALLNVTLTKSSELLWLVQPSVVQNIRATKAADPRLFVTSINGTQRLGFVAYTRTGNMNRVYQVRYAVLRTREPSFSHTQCFELRHVNCNNPHVLDLNEWTRQKNREFYLECCVPKPRVMPPRVLYVDCDVSLAHCSDGMYGILVPFEWPWEVHRPRKNVQPIVKIDNLYNNDNSNDLKSNVLLLADFAPPEEVLARHRAPQIAAVHASTGKLINLWTMRDDSSNSSVNNHNEGTNRQKTCIEYLIRYNWRGSTHILPLARQSHHESQSKNESKFDEFNDLFVSVVHRKLNHKYLHAVIILRGEEVKLSPSSNDRLVVPTRCVALFKITDLLSLSKGQNFVFAVGLAEVDVDEGTRMVMKDSVDGSGRYFALTYGIDDHTGALRLIRLSINPNTLQPSISSQIEPRLS
eukprot:TRINITY_DN6118_c0_g1_i2.p1 TRINITY_DN6118_c0_g1~~TRINITY_DN6118_c0_g1_i2.p1  ORF type:complete len:556 (-),score=40.25 TRINITY_DN6118_c0_g1_i2:103-1728(-)